MKRKALLASAILALVTVALPLFAQPVVSEKKDVAIFALGYYGFAIPLEGLGNIDSEIQKVFVDLGRFNIIGVTQRLSSGGLDQFIATLKKAKEANFVMPDKYQFGEAIMTEAEFNKLLGAFIVAAPVVSSFNSFYDQKKGQFETDIKTNVTFIDVSAGGTTIGIAQIETTGTDKSNQAKSIGNAVNAIPMQLQFEIRKVPAFTLNTRVLTVSGSEIKLQLGQNMGIRLGDEYAVIIGGTVEGFKDESEQGLVIIKNVGAEVSTGQVLYSSARLTKDIQLREVPRLGLDFEPFLHIVSGKKLDVVVDPKGDTGSNTILGFRVPLSRGFFGFRPFVAVELPLNGIRQIFTVSIIPINVLLGGEFRLHLGRLSVTPYGGVGASYIYVSEAITGTDYQTEYVPHIGAQAFVNLSYLVTRDMSIFADVGFEYWASLNTNLYTSYGGLGVGGGVSFKL